MQYPDPVERHQKSRMVRSRVVELQYAEWLEATGTSVTGLEARGALSDIESQPLNGVKTAFEVKFIGSEDNDFAMLLKSIAGQAAGGPVSPYAAINYLLFRAYEAAEQLAAVTSRRIATVIVDDFAWWRFKAQLDGRWIDWANPQFVGDDAEWKTFLKSQQGRYPDLPGDLSSTLREIDTLCILRQSASFEFTVASETTMRSA